MAEKKRRKGNMYCCVPQCGTYCFENISFHTFPTDKILREKWADILKIGKNVSPFMRVCSQHFRDEDYFFNKRVPCKVYRLKKNVVPSLNLPQDTHEIQKRNVKRENRKKSKMNKLEENLDKQEEKTICKEPAHNPLEQEMADVLISLSQETTESKEKVFVDKAVQVNTYEEFNQFDVSDIINTEKKLRILTGIPNFALLNVLAEALSKLDKSKSELNFTKLILLTLMRIKLDIPFPAISSLFNISNKSAQMYFQKTVTNLACILKTVITFPSVDEIQHNMPKCFDKYPSTRIILDCVEFEVQKGKCSKCRIHTYSNYKSKNTVKFVIGTAPAGLITFLSKAYGGSASEKGIFNKENLISKLSPGDAIMTDKRFLIKKKCAEYNIKLIRPPFLRKKRKFNKAEVIKAAEIARARAHIKKVFQKMKNFRILRNVLPFKMLSYVDSIVTIIVALTNLSKPVLSIDEFR